jgi:flagellar biosynthesis protein FliP
MAFYETLERNIRPFWNSQYSENPKKFNEEVAERNQFFKEKKKDLEQLKKRSQKKALEQTAKLSENPQQWLSKAVVESIRNF